MWYANMIGNMPFKKFKFFGQKFTARKQIDAINALLVFFSETLGDGFVFWIFSEFDDKESYENHFSPLA